MADIKKDKVKKAVATKTETKAVNMNDLTPIKLTQIEFDALDADGLRAKLCSEPQLRISRERGKEFLVDRISSGRINSITPEMIANWTYKAVIVAGVVIGGQGKLPENASKKLTQEEFDTLDAPGKAALINEFTHKRRAADVIIPDLVTAGMPMTAEDVVYLTCGRVEIEGVTVIAKARAAAHAVTEGVQFV